MFRWLLNIFWTESVWLPAGVRWEDVTNGPDKTVVYPDIEHWQHHVLLLVAGFLVLRYLLETYCFFPLGKALGIKGKKHRKIKPIPQLEAVYKMETNVFNHLRDLLSVRSKRDKERNNQTTIDMHFANVDLQGLANELDMSERQIARWWRLRRCIDKASPLTKFSEHSWKATHLTSVVVLGLYVLWDKEYFWKFEHCVIGFPHQGITKDIWWFYMIQTAYYWSLLITIFRDVRRRDLWQMFLHHLVAAFILSIAWVAQFYRVVAVFIPIMEGAEAALEITKAVKRAGYDRTALLLYFIFVVIWLYTRFYILPMQYFYAMTLGVYSFVWRSSPAVVCHVLLYIIVVLQIYWTVFVLRVAYTFFAFGLKRDARSSSSEISEDASDIYKKNGINNNGVMDGINSYTGLVNGKHQTGYNGTKNGDMNLGLAERQDA